MQELKFIDNYFSGLLSARDRVRFEIELQNNRRFAETVAFYLLVREAAHREAQSRIQPLPTGQSWRVWVFRAAAVCLLVLGISLAFRFWPGHPSGSELADLYLTEHYDRLPVQMGGPADSLTIGIDAYNQGRWAEAGAVFETLLQREPTQLQLLEYAGVVALHAKKYDQAITHFHRLGRQTALYGNPGFFLEALSYLKRGQPMDKIRAKKLLRTVIQDNLEGKYAAEQLVKQIDIPH
ncbi:tetratricopeptide repeat protein [Larkinella bovis]|uniref:Tetratricopeptide repeat protein n=1 Tax=Larkinella bovis TaxID=683041 RepID=A0ABW0I4Y7_9BACT